LNLQKACYTTAKQALESSEVAVTETNKLILEISELFNKAEKLPQPKLSDINDPNVVAQFKLAAEKFENIKQLQTKLQKDSAEIQKLYQIVHDNRGILSPSNDTPVTHNAVKAGQEACQIAQTTAATIQTMLIQVRQDAAACTDLLNEYGRLMTGGNPEAINRFLIGVNQEQSVKIRELEAQLAKLQAMQQLQGASADSSQAGSSMLPQRDLADRRSPGEQHAASTLRMAAASSQQN